LTEKSSISKSPSQKIGRDTPSRLTTIVMLEKIELGFVAEYTPTGIPTPTQKIIAKKTILKVLGKRAAICSLTSDIYMYDVPKSPWTKLKI
jgi:hypothetical protein